MKILFSDLDGTLVNGQQLLSFKNIEMAFDKEMVSIEFCERIPSKGI